MEATLSSVTSLFRVSALTGTCEEPEVTDAPMTTAEPTMMPTEPMMTEIPTSSTPTLMPSVFSPGYAVDHYNTKCGNFNDPNRTHKETDVTVETCFELCLEQPDCIYFSHND